MTNKANEFRHLQGDSHGEYRVFPEPPEPREPPEAISGWAGLETGSVGCGTWFAAFFLGLVFFIPITVAVGIFDEGQFPDAVVAWFIISGILSFPIVYLIHSLIAAKRARQFQREMAQDARKAAEAARKGKEDEANSLTARLLVVRQSFVDLATQMPELLDNASAWLQQAEDEFNDNAFGPFWEAVENSAVCLAQFGANAQELAKNADWYYAALRGRQHTFPPFPVHPAELPNPMPIADRLRSVVRRGQTNFQFAMIWEQRKTRRVLVYGFSTLEQAINGVREALITDWDSVNMALQARRWNE